MNYKNSVQLYTAVLPVPVQIPEYNESILTLNACRLTRHSGDCMHIWRLPAVGIAITRSPTLRKVALGFSVPQKGTRYGT